MNDIIALLKNFHFTESESKVYISLLENGSGTGYEISKFSGVPNSKVYTILESLIQKKVIITSQKNKNIIYKAQSVDKVSKLLRTNSINSINKFEQLATKISNKQDDEKIWELDDRDAIINSTITLVEQATSEIMLQIWVDDLNIALEQALTKKQEDGINVLIILYDLQEEYNTSLKNIYKHGFEKVKLHDLHSRWLNLTIDSKEMIYASFNNNNVMEGITTKNQSMIYFSQEYIKHDAYCLRMIHLLNENEPTKVNNYLRGVRDIFLKNS